MLTCHSELASASLEKATTDMSFYLYCVFVPCNLIVWQDDNLICTLKICLSSYKSEVNMEQMKAKLSSLNDIHYVYFSAALTHRANCSAGTLIINKCKVVFPQKRDIVAMVQHLLQRQKDYFGLNNNYCPVANLDLSSAPQTPIPLTVRLIFPLSLPLYITMTFHNPKVHVEKKH